MRLDNKYLSFVVNFLLGVSWASAFIGAISSFLFYFNQSFFISLVYACIATIPGMVGVLLLELIITNKEKHLELKKQTKLLEELLSHK